MADIFLSYARVDLAKAELFVTALEQQGWTVFWDISSILSGQGFRREITKNIDAAACVLVLWSTASVESDFVIDEAERGKRNGTLVPVSIAHVPLPLGFGSIHTDDLSQWQGDVNAPAFLKLKRAITHKLSLHRPQSISTPALQPTPVAPRPTLAVIEPELVRIPAGHFKMGSNEYEDEQPIHPVTLAQPFYLGKYPVTFSEYALFAQATQVQLPDDEGWGMGKRPVINVSWQEATDYAAWLGAQTGKAYRLPTEAEWEYACRAGTDSRFYWGDKETQMTEYAWFSGNSGGKTHPVGEKRPNAWGLYDMAGNVWEWVQDAYANNYKLAPIDGTAFEPANCAARVVRGGSWNIEPLYLRSAGRDWSYPDQRSIYLGFRLAQD